MMKTVETKVVLTAMPRLGNLPSSSSVSASATTSDVLRSTCYSEAEAYLMLEAGELIRQALAEQGYARHKLSLDRSSPNP
jgi:hypothetical protein